MSTVTELQAIASEIIGSELPHATTKLYHGIPVWCVGDQPTIGDPTLEYAIPAGVSQIVVQVRDLFGFMMPRK